VGIYEKVEGTGRAALKKEGTLQRKAFSRRRE